MTVVGLGSHGSLEGAREFPTRYGGASLLMLYDGGGQAWDKFKVLSPPYFVLFDRSGAEKAHWTHWDAGSIASKLTSGTS